MRFLAFLFIALLSSGQARADDFYTSLEILNSQAEKHDAKAEYKLGLVYSEGLFGVQVPRDAKTAIYWFERAVADGKYQAAGNVGDIYYTGHDIPKDYAEAMKWYRIAADHGSAGAQWFVGVLYSYGWGVPQDQSEAYFWFNISQKTDRSFFKALSGPVAGIPRLTLAEKSLTDVQKQLLDIRVSEWKPLSTK
jgi:TPR repeat protein